MRHIGVDLHSTQITVCYLENDEYTVEKIMLTEFDKFTAKLLPSDSIAVEATTNSNWFYAKCKDLVAKIIVVNSAIFKVIASSCNKTDDNDAMLLAKYLSNDMLPESKVKDPQLLHLQGLLDIRCLLVKQRTMNKNQIHALCLQQGIKLKASALDSIKGLNNVLNTTEGILQITLESLVRVIKSINNEIKLIDTKLADEGGKLPGYEHLTTIKGLGATTAIMLVIAIGNINNFDSNKKLAAYFGLVPTVRNSNETIKHGGITKKGDAKIRANLVQCAIVAIKYNPILGEFYKKLKLKKGHGIAIIATARKLLTIIYATLKNGWYFTDFCNNQREIKAIAW